MEISLKKSKISGICQVPLLRFKLKYTFYGHINRLTMWEKRTCTGVHPLGDLAVLKIGFPPRFMLQPCSTFAIINNELS